MKVAKLAHGLHRVLFRYALPIVHASYCVDGSPGVHPHRDLRSGVWNFPSEFSAIPTPEEYAFDRSPKYITPSQDKVSLRVDCEKTWANGRNWCRLLRGRNVISLDQPRL
jgi:hypothetical protein